MNLSCPPLLLTLLNELPSKTMFDSAWSAPIVTVTFESDGKLSLGLSEQMPTTFRSSTMGDKEPLEVVVKRPTFGQPDGSPPTLTSPIRGFPPCAAWKVIFLP